MITILVRIYFIYEMYITKKCILNPKTILQGIMVIFLICMLALSGVLVKNLRLEYHNSQQLERQQNKIVSKDGATQQYKISERIRMLSDQQQENKQKQKPGKSGSNQNKQFFLTIVIIVIVFFVLGVLCCVACIIRYICIKERSHSTSAVANSKISHQLIFPAISYPLFLAYVGQPFQAHCVICLQEFVEAKCNDEIKGSQATHQQNQQQSQLQRKFQQSSNPVLVPKDSTREPKLDSTDKKQTSNPKIKSLQYIQSLKSVDIQIPTVKFTVCGHLLHSKCLDDWLLRLQTCPLCREQFTYENISKWESKMGFNYQNEFQHILSSKISKESKKQINRQQTLAEIQKSLSRNDFQFVQGTQQHSKKKTLLQKNQKYALNVYLKIMSFHKRSIQQKEVLQQEASVQLYFNEGEDQNDRNKEKNCQQGNQGPFPSFTINQSSLFPLSSHKYHRKRRNLSNY